MKRYWPFVLAALLAGTLVALYLLEWYAVAWALVAVMIAFPLLYVLAAIAWLEWEKRRR